MVLSKESAHNLKKAWQEVNRLLGRGCRREIEVLKTKMGEMTDKQEIVMELAKIFASVVGVKEDSKEEVQENELELNVKSKFSFRQIEESEVLKNLLRLNPNKASGVDGISSKLLRMVAPGICYSLTKLFNACLQSGCMPEEWKSANITPVHKGGKLDAIGNYGPVSFLPIVVKVFEPLIHGQLYKHLQDNDILDPAQFGFRPGHSTQEALVSLVEEWREAVDEDNLVGSVFIDLSKAFDAVDHQILLRKLKCYGVEGKKLEWFGDYLSCRRQRVCLGRSKSDWTAVRRGVPQGFILGPLLF